MDSSSLLGFQNTTNNVEDNYKLVPWLNWDEWDFVRLSLFSNSAESVDKALRRVATWRSRGCLPTAVEVTASFVEIQQKDPHFSLSNGDLDSVEMLSMLYTMAIMRLVNGMIEKTRERQKLSIAVAADQIDMPRMLIDIRHEGSHRELPSLNLLRQASILALNWLKSYYWDRQKNAIPYQSAKSANVRKEIKSRLRELAFCLKLKHSSGSSQVKGKRAKHHEQLMGASASVHGHNKLFSLMACKFKPSKNVGSKKQIMKAFKKLVRLYSFFSSDVVSVLLVFLLKPSNSTEFVELPENFQIKTSLEVVKEAFDEWKPVITKFSKIEPDVLFSLINAVLDMIESHKISRDNFGNENFSLSKYDLENRTINILSSLFTWLVLILQGLNFSVDETKGTHTETDCSIPKTTLIEVIRKCLRIADPENHELLDSATLIAKMVGNSNLNERIQKVTSVFSQHSEDDPSEDYPSEDFRRQNIYIRVAAYNVETLKHRKLGKLNASEIQNSNAENGNIWTVAKSWNPCPIGMLPRAVGLSGYLPVLDYNLDSETKMDLPSIDDKEKTDPTHCDKRDANCDIKMDDESSVERMRITDGTDLSQPDDTNVVSILNGVKGRLLIGGFYQEVGDQESEDIKSRLRILVTTTKSSGTTM